MGDLLVVVEVCLLSVVNIVLEQLLEVVREVGNCVHLVAICDHKSHDVTLALRTWLL